MHNKLITFSAAAFTIFSADLCTFASRHLSSRNHCPFSHPETRWFLLSDDVIRGLNLDL